MDFNKSKLPSSSKEVEWHWEQQVKNDFNLSSININGNKINFNLPTDYFELTDGEADKIAFIGRQYSFFSQPVSMKDVELSVFGTVSVETHIGGLLSVIKHLRPTADVYGLLVKYKYLEKSVYCAITLCFVDKDIGEEMETAVIEISEDEAAYVLPAAISDEVLDYFTFDDIAKLSYWLGNFWVGAQYELNNCPEEIRVVEQCGPITAGQEEEIRQEKRPVLVKRVVSIDAEGNEIRCDGTGSGRQYIVPSWGVCGHSRMLQDGRVIQVKPYRKGKDRDNIAVLEKKEYRFVDEKIDIDLQK